MCGITGWIDWKEDLTHKGKVIEKMGKTLKNRGPDDSGIWLSTHAAFAHTRLIVIDPIGGVQPMVRQYGSSEYVIVYNGELYNTDELRKELTALGHTFHTSSDTEVLLVSYIEWKEQCVNHLNGIYAFGVWDNQFKRLFLARDRLGVKPLFYTIKDGKLLFGSEIKAILAHPEIKPVIDHEGVSEILGLGPSRTSGNGVFKGISEVKPGHYLVYDKYQLSINKYWELKSVPHEDDLEATIKKTRHLVLDAIDRQLVSDVTVCTFLSGGLDSSIISTVAANIYKKKELILNTYSIDYVGNKENFVPSEFQPNTDAPWIELMSKYIGSNHHNIMVDTKQLIEALREAVIARDLPGMADVDASLYLFSKEVKKGATVALSGECADEIFGGYPWFYRKEDLDSASFPWLRSVYERETILAKGLKSKINISNYVEKRYRETLDEVPRLKNESKEQNRMREIFYLNMTWFMQTLLERKDRMTMATGLEVRVPFADHRIVEYMWNVPWKMKNLNNREKGLLRKALEGILPHEIIKRKKSPYPKTHNPLYTQAVSHEMKRILNDSSSPIHALIDKEKVMGIADTGGQSFKIPWFGQLMTGPQLLAYLIQINIWLEEYHVSIYI